MVRLIALCISCDHIRKQQNDMHNNTSIKMIISKLPHCMIQPYQQEKTWMWDLSSRNTNSSVNENLIAVTRGKLIATPLISTCAVYRETHTFLKWSLNTGIWIYPKWVLVLNPNDLPIHIPFVFNSSPPLAWWWNSVVSSHFGHFPYSEEVRQSSHMWAAFCIIMFFVHNTFFERCGKNGTQTSFFFLFLPAPLKAIFIHLGALLSKPYNCSL